MDHQFHCQSADRRLRLAEDTSPPSLLNGIDYIEVLDSRAAEFGVPRQQALLVHCFKELPVTLDTDNVVIEGDDRSAIVKVESVFRADTVSPPFGDSGTLVVQTDSSGDYSTYTLQLVASPTSDLPPPNFDRVLSSTEFTFKVECPSDFDCQPSRECPPEPLTEPEIDYLAKDYSSFRRLILDRLSVIAPDWKDRNAADLQVTMVEILAYLGDYLSYYQDAVATEAYLHTARRRASVRRHTRMLDYHMHDGCNARAWVHLHCDVSEKELPRESVEFRTADERNYLTFAPMHDLTMRKAHNLIRFYTWEDSECCLPKGSTRATLERESGDSAGAEEVMLEAGDVLIFEEIVSPTTGKEEDADPSRRTAVRLTSVEPGEDELTGEPIVEIEWHEDDALPFALCLSARVTNLTDGTTELKDTVSVARGNVVLADHGQRHEGDTLAPQEKAAKDDYRPYLRRNGVTFRVREDPEELVAKSATAAGEQDPREALPAVELKDGDETWEPVRDLLNRRSIRPRVRR